MSKPYAEHTSNKKLDVPYIFFLIGIYSTQG